MNKRKFTDIVIDIDSLFYRVGDKSLKTISNELTKNYFNSLKENHNIYVVSNRLNHNEVEKRLKQYKVNRIPKEIYCYKDKIDFRRNVIEKLIKYQSIDKSLSSVLFVSGNPYFIKEKEELGLTTCYVRELNKKHLNINIGTISIDKVSVINSLGLYLPNEKNSETKKEKQLNNLEITDYTYIIGSGYNLLDKKEFNEKAIIQPEYNNIDRERTLAISDDPFELWSYQRQNIATLFINNGTNDTIDVRPTFEKKITVQRRNTFQS